MEEIQTELLTAIKRNRIRVETRTYTGEYKLEENELKVNDRNGV